MTKYTAFCVDFTIETTGCTKLVTKAPLSLNRKPYSMNSYHSLCAQLFSSRSTQQMGNKLGFIAISGSFVLPLYVHGCRQNHLANLWLKAATLKYLHVPVKSPRISVNVTHEDFLLGIRLHSWNLSCITMVCYDFFPLHVLGC